MGWSLPGALFDMDYVGGRYLNSRLPEGAQGGSVGDGFRQYNSSGDNGFVENADGSLVATPGGMQRRSTRGLWCELDSDNTCLWSRDLTNAVWVKAGCTAAKNQTGRDGVANGASLVTATAPAATVLQAITIASAAFRLYADIKQITGSGTIEMTLDGGTTWTVVSLASPRFNGWSRVNLPAQTLANPTVGFRIATSGDAFAIDLVQPTTAPYERSAVFTTATVQHHGYDLPSADRDWFSPLAGFESNRSMWSYYWEWVQRRDGYPVASSGAVVGIYSQASAANLTVGVGSSTGSPFKLPTAAVMSPPDYSFSAINRLAISFDGGGNRVRVSLNGAAVVYIPGGGSTGKIGANTNVGHWDSGTDISGNGSIDGVVRRTTFLPRMLSDAELMAWTSGNLPIAA